MKKDEHPEKVVSIKLPTYGVKGEKTLTDAELKHLRDDDDFFAELGAASFRALDAEEEVYI